LARAFRYFNMGGNGFLDWLCNRSIQVGLIYYLKTASVG
jgi:hypothetical protein